MRRSDAAMAKGAPEFRCEVEDQDTRSPSLRAALRRLKRAPSGRDLRRFVPRVRRRRRRAGPAASYGWHALANPLTRSLAALFTAAPT